MEDKPIDFMAAKERLEEARTDAEIEADQAKWERARNSLIEAMLATDLSTIGLTSATLRALLDILTASDMELEEAKKSVGRALNAFFKSKP